MSRWRARSVSANRLTTSALLACGGLMGIAVVWCGDVQAQAPSRPSRSIVVIGDLHMGVGRDGSGAWSPFEDFRWSSDFAGFLETIAREGGDAVDLVLNGDTFELTQSDGDDCAAALDLGCTEPEARARLDRVLAAHQPEMAALRAFAKAGSNRVVFVAGDADAALLWPSLQRRLLATLGAPGERARVAGAAWLSEDGRVHAEHGHQIGPGGPRFDDWPSPFVRRNGRTHLGRPFNARVTSSLYARLEPTFPVVDNVAVLGAGLKYAVAAEGTPPAAAVTPDLIRDLLLSTVSWQQFRMELDDGDVEPPAWDLTQVRAQGAAFFVSALPDDDPLRPAAAALEAGTLTRMVQSLTDEELGWLCDYRAAVRRARRRFEPAVSQFAPRGPAVGECPRRPDTRGATFDYFWRSRDLVFGRYVETVSARLSRPTPAVFVLGHSHLPDRSQSNANMISGGLLTIPLEGFSPVRGALAPVVINGGAWQRTLTPVQLERLLADRTLRDVSLDDLAPCYSYVAVPAYTDAPAPIVRYWRRDRAGAWATGAACGPP